MAHGQWTEVEARGALEAWKRSGMSLEAFARSRGIVPQRLHWWMGLPRSLGQNPYATFPTGCSRSLSSISAGVT